MSTCTINDILLYNSTSILFLVNNATLFINTELLEHYDTDWYEFWLSNTVSQIYHCLTTVSCIPNIGNCPNRVRLFKSSWQIEKWPQYYSMLNAFSIRKMDCKQYIKIEVITRSRASATSGISLASILGP